MTTVRAAVALSAVLALAACDTGDGKTLQQPSGPTTVTLVESETLPSIPLDATLPAEPLGDGSPPAASPFAVIGPWLDGATIDARHTCDGEDVAPAFSWVAPPDGTIAIAFVMVDETMSGDVPTVHWVLAGVEPDAVTLLEGDTPIGAITGLNSFGEVGWTGPCPPVGDPPHSYRVTAYALNQQVELADGTPATELLGFIEDVAIGSTDLVGTYGR